MTDPFDDAAAHDARAKRLHFIDAMLRAGWRPQHDLSGALVSWHHGVGRNESDDDAFAYWRAEGDTPPPF